MSGAAGAKGLVEEAIPKGDSAYAIAFRQFRKDKVAVAALISLILVGAVSVFSPLLANSKPIVASYQDGIHFPAFKDYLDENIPVPPGISSWLRRTLPGAFSPKYESIKRPAWQQVPDWKAITRKIDEGAPGWYLMPPVPWYYNEDTSGVKLLPGFGMCRIDLAATPQVEGVTLEFVPERPAEQELAKVRRRLPPGATSAARVEFDRASREWTLVDPSTASVETPKGWKTFDAGLGPRQIAAVRSPDERQAGEVICYWEWRERYLPAGAELERTPGSLARALRFWAAGAPRRPAFRSSEWKELQGRATVTARRTPTESEARRSFGSEAAATTLSLVFTEDRVFTVLVTAPVSKRQGYEGPLAEELVADVLGSLQLTAPSGTTRIGERVVRGRLSLQDGDALDLSGVKATFVAVPPFMLGSDSHGRCVLSRLIHGTVIAGSVGIISVGIYVCIGIFLGSLAGYYRGWVDLVISRVIEIVICFPTLFLIIMVVGFWQKQSIYLIMVALGLIRWTGVARLVRGEILKVMSADYVSAAKALGLPSSRIIFRHILPNSIAPVFVSASFGVAGAILIESSLSFLGFGVAPPTASWGEILRQGREFVNEGLYHLVWAPGFCIFFTVTMFNLVGEGLRDALDPKLRR